MNQQSSENLRKKAYMGIFLMGIVSLMGDIVYEGSRGIVPGFLSFLGATEIIVGIVGGLGDFLGNAIRLVSGYLADSTRAYWIFIFIGYGLIGAIPFLGVSLGLEMAIMLVLLERLGKAFRAPSRDTVISIISKEVGSGKAFGFHEMLDQIGGMLGPLIVSALMFYSNNDYRSTFSFLFIPFFALLATLLYTYTKINQRTTAGRKTETKEKAVGKMSKRFYVYTVAVLLNAVGLIPYALILYRAGEVVLPTQLWIIPLIYLLIQGVDAPSALMAGYAYDRFGMKLLVVPFVLSLFSFSWL
ncbi:MAG: MFS transporter [Candidatus Bathyarchaeia archaeon]